MTPDESAWVAFEAELRRGEWSALADVVAATVRRCRASGAFGEPHSEGPQHAFAPYDNGSLADRDHCAVHTCVNTIQGCDHLPVGAADGEREEWRSRYRACPLCFHETEADSRAVLSKAKAAGYLP